MTTRPAKKPAGRRTKKLTPKQKLIKTSAQQRFNIQKITFEWQEKLFSQPKVPIDTLTEAAIMLQPQTYEEVIEERMVQELCGYPLCDQPPQKPARYRISYSQRKVFDQTELASYCSDACLKKSKYYAMQLSEEAVWARDLSLPSTVHVVPLLQDFREALLQEKKRSRSQQTVKDIRHDYVQRMLAGVPTAGKMDVEIVEKVAQKATLPAAGVHDAIEGYRIQVNKSVDSPTTIVLNKEKKILNKEKKTVEAVTRVPDLDDQDALLDDAMETMMMLKSMNLDQPDTVQQATEPQPLPVKAKPINPPKDQPSAVAGPPKDATKVIQVTTKEIKKPKKKSKALEMSLFGKVWTMVDSMTTRLTRLYLSDLENTGVVDMRQLFDGELVKETDAIRGHIFSEKILETYALIRTQITVRSTLENDLVDLIKTFRFADASMIVLDAPQAYMMTLVLFKALADLTLENTEWVDSFEKCCASIGQTSDVIDACVRVLKVAST
ncbi:RNA polymerase II associated protein 2 [Apophysomyces sp. BC1034]|nr:RNA polymerase II associated protein 2 [Apophysomyces sp. BC1015]KAG0181561.1 RNA polymerase II associated protein 2 [Apophysomyces sp. BC1021]KAG0192191.1 RNA polymerase II associated protein 2 [Apophysomyces sp. BC1034]